MGKYVVFGNDVAPVHDGMYQREFSTFGSRYTKSTWIWAKFDNNKWHIADTDKRYAETTDYLSGYQVGCKSLHSPLRWRGLNYHEYMRGKNAVQKQSGS